MNLFKISKYFLRLNALMLFAFGIMFLLQQGTVNGFQSIQNNTLVELFFYIGLEIGLSVFLIWSSLSEEKMLAGLSVFTFLFFFAGAVRILGFVVLGFEGLSHSVIGGVEVSFALFSYYLRTRLSLYF